MENILTIEISPLSTVDGTYLKILSNLEIS